MVYVTSDIHGNTDRYRSIMSQINLQPEDTLYILGDVIDRYPGGIDLLLEIMEAPNIRMLLGNHEYMMLCAIGDEKYRAKKSRFLSLDGYEELWYRNRGLVTHQALDTKTPEEQQRIIEFLRDLPVNIDIKVGEKRFKLVHASPLTKYTQFNRLYHSSYYVDKVEYAVWERISPIEPSPQRYTLVFGHTPTLYYQSCNPLQIYKRGRMIGIDCGCGYSSREIEGGRLACLRLDDMKEFYSEE